GSLNADLCQDQVSAGVGAGDSGSPVFAIASGNDVQLRGILWGGTLDGTSFVYSPIANIERTDELGPITTCAAGFTCRRRNRLQLGVDRKAHGESCAQRSDSL